MMLQRPLRLQPVRGLTLRRSTHTAGQNHLSAASGLVCAHGCVYVIGDDEHHLALFADAITPGCSVRLFAGDLPPGKKARKRRKPDSETLALLPSGRALLTLGSGSKPNRCRGAWVALGSDGVPRPPARSFDLTPLYAALCARFGEVNIEGAFFLGRDVVLLQRGHRRGAPNAAVHYRAEDWLAWLADPASRAPSPQQVREHRLPRVCGVPLAFTDGAALRDGRWLFTAVAEAADDAIVDGPCVGSAVGLVGADGNVQRLWPLADSAKVEGIAARRIGGAIDIALVTDADDPTVPSRLLVARLSGL